MSIYMECDEPGCSYRVAAEQLYSPRIEAPGWDTHPSAFIGKPTKHYCPEHRREWKP